MAIYGTHGRCSVHISVEVREGCGDNIGEIILTGIHKAIQTVLRAMVRERASVISKSEVYIR